MRIEIMKVTPRVAASWLDHNHVNRPLDERRIKQWIKAIDDGQWMLTGDTVKLSPGQARLLDGQHRLTAIVRTGKTVETAVAFDVDEAVYAVLDSGKPRSPGNALGPDALSASQAAASIRIIMTIGAGGDPRSTYDTDPWSRPDIAQFYAENKDRVDEVVRLGGRMYKALVVRNQSAWAAFYWYATEQDRSAADLFTDAVRTGAGLEHGDPRLALRNWLSVLTNRKRVPRAGDHLVLIIKSWNAWVSGEGRQLLLVRPDEEFPTVRRPRKFKNPAAVAS